MLIKGRYYHDLKLPLTLTKKTKYKNRKTLLIKYNHKVYKKKEKKYKRVLKLPFSAAFHGHNETWNKSSKYDCIVSPVRQIKRKKNQNWINESP